MEWLAFLRTTIAFVVFYIAIPTAARGKQAWRSPFGWASSFIRFSVFLELSILLLGLARFALPGALAAVCALWLSLDALQNRSPRLQASGGLRSWLIERLAAWDVRAQTSWTPRVSPALWKRGAQFGGFVALTLAVRGWFPVQNLRFERADDYARALSLAILSEGLDWSPDLSAPLLLPLQRLASLSAPRAVAFGEPLFAALLVAGVGLVVGSLVKARLSGVAAMSVATVVALSQGSEFASPARLEMGAAYVILSAAVWRRSRRDALLAATMGVAMAPSLELLQILAPYAACIGVGMSTAHLRWRRDLCAKVVAATTSSGALLLGLGNLAERRPDGPLQLEEAARAACGLAADLPRKSWILVSSAQELPYIYGQGWHMQISQFVATSDIAAARRPSYRIALPVRDVYFLIESEPLPPRPAETFRASGSITLASAIRGPASPAVLGHASYQFQLAEWLAAYRGAHDDLETVYRGDSIIVMRAPGSLAR